MYKFEIERKNIHFKKNEPYFIEIASEMRKYRNIHGFFEYAQTQIQKFDELCKQNCYDRETAIKLSGIRRRRYPTIWMRDYDQYNQEEIEACAITTLSVIHDMMSISPKRILHPLETMETHLWSSLRSLWLCLHMFDGKFGNIRRLDECLDILKEKFKVEDGLDQYHAEPNNHIEKTMDSSWIPIAKVTSQYQISSKTVTRHINDGKIKGIKKDFKWHVLESEVDSKYILKK